MEPLIIKGHYTVDGAGVKLFRVFAHESTSLTDPFLLLDNFGSDNPMDYIKGFPWHPHRGIETVTYMLDGEVEHGDSLGNKGVIEPGDVQWMSAGSGIIHQEMPKPRKGMMHGFQLWVNLPAAKKMSPPKYRGIIAKEITEVRQGKSAVKVIAGEFAGVRGPVKDLMVDVTYLDVQVEKSGVFEFKPKRKYNSFCYAYSGAGEINGATLEKGQLILFNDASNIKATATQALRFILVSGEPLHEPIAWGGPIVMSTEEELETAFMELEEGTFIKK